MHNQLVPKSGTVSTSCKSIKELIFEPWADLQMRPNDLVQEPWVTELWLFYCHLPETPHYPFLQPLLLSSYDVEDQMAKVVRPLTRESFLTLALLKTDHFPSYLISVRAIYVICKCKGDYQMLHFFLGGGKGKMQ